MKTKNNIALTMGDPSGIGPELAVKILGRQIKGITVYGDMNVLKKTAQALKIDIKSNNIIHVETKVSTKASLQIGTPTLESGEISFWTVVRAVEDCLLNKVSAIVTGPISKFAWKLAGHNWPGHTELLAHLSDPKNPPKIRMMLKSPNLSIVLNSTHLSLKSAIMSLTFDGLIETIKITNSWFKRVFKKTPVLLLAALNPHAGENGMLGNEENKILKPVIKKSLEMGINISGPWPADTVFLKAIEKKDKYDAVIALYHDQALIPFKLNGLENGINTTIGLPFIRTSVDHGTAFDIAGKNKASDLPMLTAIQSTKELIKNEQSF